MIKLSPSHLAILATACSRGDEIAVRPLGLKPAAAAKAATKLVELALVREVCAKGDMPTWREDEQGNAFCLKLLKAGRLAVQAMAPSAGAATANNSDPTVAHKPNDVLQIATGKSGSKREAMLALLAREGGVTMDDLIAATGWLPHTTRAALSGLRKSGFVIVRTRDDGAVASVYRIDPVATAAAA